MSNAALPPPPPHVAPFIEVLGLAEARLFLMTFGGSEVYLPESYGSRSDVVQLIGAENARALEARIGKKIRVPLADRWLIHCLHAEGLSGNEIARRLRISSNAVRVNLREDPAAPPSRHLRSPDPRQPSLL